jgi:hypothetical protein
MIDRLNERFAPHFLDLPNVTYVSTDIFKSDTRISELLASQPPREPGGRSIGILVGMHLCGFLSEKCIELFRTIERVRGIVLSPCCLPHQAHSYIVHAANKAKCDQYNFWCLHLNGLVRAAGGRKTNLVRDAQILSERNAVITAIKEA